MNYCTCTGLPVIVPESIVVILLLVLTNSADPDKMS